MAAREEANAKRQTVANTKAERKTVRRAGRGARVEVSGHPSFHAGNSGGVGRGCRCKLTMATRV
jgi:hypothetical protein